MQRGLEGALCSQCAAGAHGWVRDAKRKEAWVLGLGRRRVGAGVLVPVLIEHQGCGAGPGWARWQLWCTCAGQGFVHNCARACVNMCGHVHVCTCVLDVQLGPRGW